MTNHNSPQPTEQPEVLYRWVKASERLPEPNKQQYIKNGGNWDLGHYDPAKDDFCCLGGWTKKRKDLIEWLEPLPSPIKGEEVDALAANHARLNYAKAPYQSEKDAEYIQDVSYHSFLAGFAASHPSLSVDAEPSPQQENLWPLLTKSVCGRDMESLNYYKEDLLFGLGQILANVNKHNSSVSELTSNEIDCLRYLLNKAEGNPRMNVGSILGTVDSKLVSTRYHLENLWSKLKALASK